MFDIGFSELMIIGIVALVVIGPERLPRVARAAGLLLGRLQRYVSDVKADISREMQFDELKRMQEQVNEQVMAMGNSVSQEMRAVEQSLRGAIDDVDVGEPEAADAPAPPEADPRQLTLDLEEGRDKAKI